MRWKLRPTTEFVFALSGLLIILLGWIADLLGALTVPAEEGHGASSSLSLRLLVTFMGVGFALMGVVYEHLERFLKDGILSLRYVVGYLILADGALHLYALNDHLSEFWTAAFFATVAVVEIAAGLALPHLAMDFDPLWLWLTGFLIAAYVATRMMIVWPNTEVEVVSGLDLASKLVEVLAVLALVQLLRKERALRTRSQKADSAGTDSSHS